MVHPKLKRRFSIPNHDQVNATYSEVARTLKNADKDFQEEIHDIFFGGIFSYTFNGQQREFGDVMGTQAGKAQVYDLLDIQELLGIPISLTLNDMNFKAEISGNKVIREQFISFVKSYYDAGVRHCILSDVHLMTTGILQENFPDMIWKNTVNHLVTSAQEVMDYAAVGYKIINVDRSLVRNIRELKKIRKVSKKLGVKISQLIAEGCMPSCPYKQEHDSIQPETFQGYKEGSSFKATGGKVTSVLQNKNLATYWGQYGDLSCNRWRSSNHEMLHEQMPRTNVNLIAVDKDTLNIFLDNTDIFKFSGRLKQNAPFEPNMKACIGRKSASGDVYANSFTEVYEKNLMPWHSWDMTALYGKSEKQISSLIEDSISKYNNSDKRNIWLTPDGKKLNDKLTTCKNQCYDCHMCERVFGVPDLDTILSMNKNMATDWISKVDNG